MPAATLAAQRRLRLAEVAVVSLLAGALALASASPLAAADDDDAELRQIGRMSPAGGGRPMAVDDERSLGVVADGTRDSYLHLMDLSRMVEAARTPTVVQGAQSVSQPYGYSPESSLLIDVKRSRLYATGSYSEDPSELTCAADDASLGSPGSDGPTQSGPRKGQPVFDYRDGPDGRPAIIEKRMGPMPCTGPNQAPFVGLVGAYDDAHDLLYMGGTATTESWRTKTGFAGVFESFAGGTFQDDRAQPLLLRQLEVGEGELVPYASNRFGTGAAPLRLDWEVDLRLAGCGRRNHVRDTLFKGFIARLGDDVLAYCWDGRPYRGLQVGQQGYVVRIPLVADPANGGVMVPQSRGGGPADVDPATRQVTDFVARRTPTLAGDVTVVLDPVSGRLMLVTSGATNGNAVWVFDPRTSRFVGVITGGYSDQPVGNTAVGFDSRRGRVYVLTQAGLLIAPIRSDPLPAGLLYPVLVNSERKKNFVGSDRIAVAPALGRLFVDRHDHYAVIEDRVPDPPPLQAVDPDSLTTQVQEKDGRTTATATSRGLASGVHLVNAGGVPRLIGQSDPSCAFSPPNLQTTNQANPQQKPIPDWELAPAVFGACLPDLLVSAGHREAVTGASEVEAGTSSGATARGSAFSFGSTDTGTDGDVRRVSDCGVTAPDQAHQWARRWPFPDDASLAGDNSPTTSGHVVLNRKDKQGHEQTYNQNREAFWGAWADEREEGQEGYRGGCNAVQDGIASRGGPDLRAGTRGPDGAGFPIPAATCADFGGNAGTVTWPPAPSGYASSATCDASGPTAQSVGAIGGIGLPNASAPELSVGRAWSKVSTVRTEQGQVTTAVAVAEGVTAGPLSIGQVRSLAVTTARGRTGTASAVLVRQWCGIRLANQREDGCIDPATDSARQLLEELNAAVLQKMQLSVPDASVTATPGGYQAVVTKDAAQRGGDQAVNDDDSHTVSALEVVVYNDGVKGRSRLVAQLAGVHAESRYGIIELPMFGGDSPPPDGGEPVAVVPPAAPVQEPTTPQDGGATVVPDVFENPAAYEVSVTEEIERRSFAPSAPGAVAPPRPSGRAGGVTRIPFRIVSDAINLLVQNPREAALLFLMFSLLAAPGYLGMRRRSFVRSLASP